MHDGQLSQGYMGLDYRRGGDTLMGVALAHGNSRLYYRSGSVGRGDVMARLMSVYPYARWAPRRGLDLWGVVGVGRGRARLVYRGRTDLNSDVGLRLAAVGARNLLLTYLGVGVAVKADAFAVRLQPEENEELAAVSADAQRLRLLLEGSTNWTLTPRSRLTPSLEVGGRWDRGDAETGVGAEGGRRSALRPPRQRPGRGGARAAAPGSRRVGLQGLGRQRGAAPGPGGPPRPGAGAGAGLGPGGAVTERPDPVAGRAGDVCK